MEESKKAEDLQLIDIEKVFAAKDAKLLKRIPNFFIRYLKRIVHQEEINNFLIKNQGIEGMAFVKKALEYMDVDLTIKREELLPENTRIIIVSNHPLGGLDGSLLINTIYDRMDRGVKVTSNDLLMNVRPMRPIFLGINKHGGNSRAHIKELQDAFDGEHPVIFFPAGLVSRRRNGVIEDTEWKRTFIKKAILHQRDVLPVHFSGRVSGFFYRLANLRKFLGIKYNIEMLYLPNEMFKHKHQKITMTYGEIIPWQSFTKEKTTEEWAQNVKAKVYDIGKKS